MLKKKTHIELQWTVQASIEEKKLSHSYVRRPRERWLNPHGLEPRYWRLKLKSRHIIDFLIVSDYLNLIFSALVEHVFNTKKYLEGV